MKTLPHNFLYCITYFPIQKLLFRLNYNNSSVCKCGLLFNIILGLLGGFVGGFLFGLLNIPLPGYLGDILSGVVGSCLLIFVVRLIKK
ncbi:MAG: GlsB/YeaQ/YmgE family stress response membrane protein [Lachnospiraceae bacterium]|nr:GlsB/YeaQ/YmgE family stress response membrane protein [Lachnospiraceae bacterium]